MNSAVDILILSNGPGELATWVKPVVHELRRQLGDDRAQVRISVVLSPCVNASGQEAAIARRYPEVDRVQAASHFFPFLLWGRTAENWDWRSQGVVLFLGGDQFFPVVIGKRLGYRTVIYAEWEARWHRWIDRFGVMNAQVCDRIPPKFAPKFTIVGDLMAEAAPSSPSPSSSSSPHPLIGLLPGSKPMKLSLGVPLCLAIAEQMHQSHPEIRFSIPVAPTLDLPGLAKFADPDHNPAIAQFSWGQAELVMPPQSNGLPYLKTPTGLHIDLWTEFPAYDLLAQCDLCLTTIGANTAELGALAVPMIVLLPTQQMDIMRAWDGLPGLLVNLPGVGRWFAKQINRLALRRIGLLAWPNIWAKAEIVPELVGQLQPADVAAQALTLLAHPEQLQQMSNRLRQVRGAAGAAAKLVQIVVAALKEASEPTPRQR
ncbi:lipid-A-disaccharide synthase [Pantanalinema sp. GBBB05]|uniref:lipid-A-disaccharide synthase n=1 Tax=Pantanalinema sp. GBBB05 TaxID=2604139 RepID=UPI001D30EBDC|nr:lipid-A-disaccharide synthase [Pantanalinema sp. GBBB05]